jgi:lantibiotic leader peptide-processing serine protease
VRKVLLIALAVLVAAALALPASAGPSGQAGTAAQSQSSGQLQSANGEYVVAYADGVSAATARAAIKAAGGTVLKENSHVGVATVKSANPAFLRAAAAQRALVGAARNRPVGRSPAGAGDKDSVERLTAAERAAVKGSAKAAHPVPNQEPFADKQWDMRMIDATPSGSYRVNQGRRHPAHRRTL